MFKKVKKTILLVLLFNSLCISLVHSNPVIAKEGFDFAKQLEELKKLYELGMKQLEEFKIQSEMLIKVKDFYQEVKKQRDALREFGDLEFWKNKISSDLQGLNDFAGMDNPNLTTEQKIDRLMQVIEKRVYAKSEFNQYNTNDRVSRNFLITQKVILGATKISQHMKDIDPKETAALLKIQERIQQDEEKREFFQKIGDEIDYVFFSRSALSNKN